MHVKVLKMNRAMLWKSYVFPSIPGGTDILEFLDILNELRTEAFGTDGRSDRADGRIGRSVGQTVGHSVGRHLGRR